MFSKENILQNSKNDLANRLLEINARLDDMQDRLHLALNAGHIGIWDWNVVTGELHWDDRMFILFGVNPADFTGDYEGFARCLIEEDSKTAAKLLSKAIASKSSYDYSYRLKSRPGVTIRGKGKCYYENGQPSRFVGVCLEEKI